MNNQLNSQDKSYSGDWRRVFLVSTAIGVIVAATVQNIMNQKSEYLEPKTDDNMTEWHHKAIVDSTIEDSSNFWKGKRLSPSQVIAKKSI